MSSESEAATLRLCGHRRWAPKTVGKRQRNKFVAHDGMVLLVCHKTVDEEGRHVDGDEDHLEAFKWSNKGKSD